MGGTIVFTFDTYQSAYSIGSQLLYDRNIKATFFSQPDRMGNGTELDASALAVLKGLGHEIGLYIDAINTTANPVTWHDPLLGVDVTVQPGGIINMLMYHSVFGLPAANSRIALQHSKLKANGHNARTGCASGRRWDSLCANFSRDLFKGVRVAAMSGYETYPLADPLYLDKGALGSLNNTVSLQTITDAMDAAVAANGILFVVVHDISASGDDAYKVDTAKLAAAMDYAVSLRTAGTARVCTLEQALTAP